MPQTIFAIGDPHGEEEKLKTLLTHWNPDAEQLVILGDLIDRGPNSLGVIRLARHLQNTYGAIILQGNHEEMFLNWLQDPLHETEMYYPQGGRETIHSFFQDSVTFTHLPEFISARIQQEFPEEISFLSSLPYYYEHESFLFVHAGVNLYLNNWKNTSTNEFTAIKAGFPHPKNDTGKIIVFGHTRTRLLHKSESDDVWFSPCRTKIGIDGSAVYGGKLHGIKLNTEPYKVVSC